MNWRDTDNVLVGWIDRPELGMVSCEVIERWPNPSTEYRNPHPVKNVRYCKGAVASVTYCHSQARYVFMPYHPTCSIVYRGRNAAH